ncbi:dihydroneopterin aldolase [Bacteroidetes/Chlorobi group bacterium ChocPot_Mid]|jgi:dihydroneopterin aldolase|nr:MAG: dihydroneopterin aldolase [Bacteroidetes/Chlorobi group bacterium ChocPot_Mid]
MKKASLMKLSIVGAQFYAYHGVKSEEQQLGGKYEVDLEMYYDATHSIINDDVNMALNYEEAFFCIEEVIAGENYNLIETLAREILNLLMEKFPELQKAKVRVRKMGVPIRRIVKFIEAEQTLSRKQLE